MIQRTQINVRGVVQGVGFRPYVFNLCKKLGLRGYILNDSTGIQIDVEGEDALITKLLELLRSNPPPLANIETLNYRDNLPVVGYREFSIRPSQSVSEKFVLLSPDIATCDACLQELFNPEDRRYRYPFINCTNCGPRFSIIIDIPYDRAKTTMAEFPMCELCQSEYDDPSNRRFHAQPNACPSCGPMVQLLDSNGHTLDESAYSSIDGVHAASNLLKQGKIAAMKGIGGFHLVCDALNEEAVCTLRRRKYREDKPFALMALDIAAIEEYCHISSAEKQILTSPQRPIVLLPRTENSRIAPSVAPNQKHLGFMLPYMPLHYLLLQDTRLPLVMISGNFSDEPICYKNEDVLERLKSVANFFLMHDREIHIRCDDSVIRVWDEKETIIRRSRGFSPFPIKMDFKFKKPILACGAELKNTFCLTYDSYAFLSHHIGDLENLETLISFEEGVEHFKRLFNIEPEVIAYDLHPDYLSTKYAQKLEGDLQKIGVQHHHAHIASCMVENDVAEKVIGVALDGTGYGTDGHIWGGEFLVADFEQFERVAHLEYAPMPGGVKAIQEPWRMGAAYLYQSFGEDFLNLGIEFVKEIDHSKWHILKQLIDKNLNSPLTSGMGRLFDAVSAILGIRSEVNYEGQAAVELEMQVSADCQDANVLEVNFEKGVVKTHALIEAIVNDLQAGIDTGKISAKFHNALVEMIRNVVSRIREERGLNRVALSGGVFQNMFLLERICQKLLSERFEVLTHHKVPTNDGGIAVGQSAIANAKV